jgi:hypothetical protein
MGLSLNEKIKCSRFIQRNWWKTSPEPIRTDDGLPKGLDKIRVQRIKQLGNSVVPGIVEIIGSQILKHEGLK